MSRYLAAAAICAALLWTAPGSAATISVGCNVPALINAIETANSNGEADIIELAPNCTYSLQSPHNVSGSIGNGLPIITINNTEALEIRGHNATIERSDATGVEPFRIVDVLNNSAASAAEPGPHFVLRDLTLRNGRAETLGSSTASEYGGNLLLRTTGGTPTPSKLINVGLIDGWADSGGGLLTQGPPTEIEDCLFDNNYARLMGGGLLNMLADVTIKASRIINNKVGAADMADWGLNIGVISGGAGVGAFLGASLTIIDSEISGNEGYGLGGAGIGGNAVLSGSLVNSSVHDNRIRAPDDPNGTIDAELGSGGGVALGSFSIFPSEFAISNSAIYNNRADTSGGGIGAAGAQTLIIENTTISGNEAGLRSGGVGNAATLVTLINTTITDNKALTSSGLGNGIYTEPGGGDTFGTAAIINTVIAGNRVGPDCMVDGGTIAENIASLLGTDGTGADACDGSGGTHFALRGDAKLGSLAANGGPHPNHMPQAGSPLIDAGAAGWNSSPFDQRGPGFPRVCGAGIDIGAIETAGSTCVVSDVIFQDGFDGN